MFAALKEKWHNLNEREQKMLCIGGPIVLVLLLYGLVFHPMQSNLAALKTQVKEQTSLLGWMQNTSSQILQLKAQGFTASTSNTNSPTVVAVQRSLQKAKLMTYLRQPPNVNNDAVQLQFALIPFDTLTKWLNQVWKQQNVVIQSMTVQRTQAPGLVNVTLSVAQGS